MAKSYKIPADDLWNDYGLDVDKLSDNIYEVLKKGQKTPLLQLVAKTNKANIPFAARVRLWEQDGQTMVYLHTVKSNIDLRPYKGHTFDKTEKAQLLDSTKGQIDHPIKLNLDGKWEDCLVGVDEKTREIIHIPTKFIHIQDRLMGVDMNQTKDIIKSGGKAYVEGFVLPSTREKLPGSVVFYNLNQNNANGGLSFRRATPKEIQEARQYARKEDNTKSQERKPRQSRQEERRDNIRSDYSKGREHRRRGI